MKNNIIILVANGFIGKEISSYFASKNEYNVIRHSRNLKNSNDGYFCCDLGDSHWHKLIEKIEDPIIINCAGVGLAKLKKCSMNNEFITRKLVDSLKNHNKRYKLIHLSSVKAFNPNNYNDPYSIDKLKSENILTESGIFSGEIIRLPIVIGKNDKNFNPLVYLSKLKLLPGVNSKIPKWNCISNYDVAVYIENYINRDLFNENKFIINYLLSKNNFNINDMISAINKKNGNKTKFISLKNIEIIFNILSAISFIANKMKYSSLPKERFLDIFVREWFIEKSSNIKLTTINFDLEKFWENYE